MKIMIALVVSCLLAACASPGERCRGKGESINPPAAKVVSENRS
jgi:outer membrane biogenesis lipoprotein LolB